MASAVHILGFSGSLRKGSFNTAFLRVASQLLPPDVTLETFDLAPIPLYNGDVEAAGFPEAVVRFKQRIAAADALLIATPEYNYSIPGVLKNAIDWASRPPKDSPLNGKPVAFMGLVGSLEPPVRSTICARSACSPTCCQSTVRRCSSCAPRRSSTRKGTLRTRRTLP